MRSRLAGRIWRSDHALGSGHTSRSAREPAEAAVSRLASGEHGALFHQALGAFARAVAGKRAEVILVTGASGFIGARLVRRLRSLGLPCRPMLRHPQGWPGEVIADLDDRAALQRACEGIDTVFHCAGHAHAFSCQREGEALHWQVNFEGSQRLGELAQAAGVRRFVFLSSVKAMPAPEGGCLDEAAPGEPDSAYGRAKRAAEEALQRIAAAGAMEVCCLRPVMVYGAGGRGNLERMAAMIKRGLFPPLPETGNRRSLVHVDDLIDAMLLVAREPAAQGRTYIVTGPETPSGRQLYDALRLVMGLPAQRGAVPAWLLSALARLGDGIGSVRGRRFLFDREVLSRLLDSACYSGELITRELNWRARYGLLEGLKEMVGVDQASI